MKAPCLGDLDRMKKKIAMPFTGCPSTRTRFYEFLTIQTSDELLSCKFGFANNQRGNWNAGLHLFLAVLRKNMLTISEVTSDTNESFWKRQEAKRGLKCNPLHLSGHAWRYLIKINYLHTQFKAKYRALATTTTDARHFQNMTNRDVKMGFNIDLTIK